jgi:hypothetical protein
MAKCIICKVNYKTFYWAAEDYPIGYFCSSVIMKRRIYSQMGSCYDGKTFYSERVDNWDGAVICDCCLEKLI